MHRQHPIAVAADDPLSVTRARRRRHNRIAVVRLNASVHPGRKSRPYRDGAVVTPAQEELRIVFAGGDACRGGASVAQGRDGRGLRTDGCG